MLDVDVDVRIGGYTVACRLDVSPGSVIALIGASGAGKTTVLRSIAGLARPQRGRIACNGETWFDAEQHVWVAPQQRDCAFVFAEYVLFEHMSVIENIAFGLRALGETSKTARKKALDALDLIGAPELEARRATTLSSGEAQRVAIARALVLEPRVLLLDEPLAAIDVERRPPIREMLQQRVEQTGISCVLVTHEPVEAMLFSDTLIVMEAGTIVQRGSPAELRERPRTSYVAAFAGVNLYRGVAHPLPNGVSEVDVVGSALIVVGELSGPVALVIDPDAVVLSRTRPESSARNALLGNVASIVPDGAAVRVSVASSPPIVARVTKQSADELGIAPGVSVCATFKASEIRVH